MKLMKILGIMIVLVLLCSFASAAIVKTVILKPAVVKPTSPLVIIPQTVTSTLKFIPKTTDEPKVSNPFAGGVIRYPKYYLDVLDKAPSIIDIDVDPVTPHVDDSFDITVEAIDNEGIDTIRLKKGSTLLGSEDCAGANICEKTFTVTESVAGDYIYKAFADDTDVNHDIEYIEVTVIECTDSDSDGFCDEEEDAGCVGENLGNMPSDTDCTTYTFELGCHVENYDGGSTVCDADVGDVYSCIDGTDPGDDVYFSMTRQYCGVGTGVCDGSTETYGGWGLFDDCTLSEYCVESNPECQPEACDDTDNDGMCDEDEDADCVGENLSNMPIDTVCLSYTFELGCHVENYEDYGHVVATVDCDYLDDVCVNYDDVFDICDGNGTIIPGTCNDFTNDGGTTVCDSDIGDVYSCVDGTEPGDDVYDSMTRQYCGVGTGNCNGNIETYGGWGLFDDCTFSEYCVEGNDTCQSVAPPFEMNLTANVTQGQVPLYVNLICSWGGGEPPYSYNFEFGGPGDLIDISFNPLDMVYVYNTTGIFEAKCNVSDNNSVRVVKSVFINVTEGPELPSISNVTLTPDPAYTDDILTCTPNGWNSSVGDPEGYYYIWKNNNVIILGEYDNTLDCDVNCDKGDTIKCEVTPHDSAGNGVMESSSVVISNSLPSVNLSLSPNPAYWNDSLDCICNATDADGDSADCYYYEFWFQLINGSWFRLYNGTSDTLPYTVVFKDDNYKCYAKATDGEDTTGLIESPMMTISNYGPELIYMRWVSEINYTDGTDPYKIYVYDNDDGFIQVVADDPETAITPTYTCYGDYEVTDCTFNYTAISDVAPEECNSHVDSGCYGIVDDQGLFEIIIEMTDVDGNKVNESVLVDVTLRYIPPQITVADEYNLTEGDALFCPCFASDPDGGTTNVTCGDPINGSGLDYWIPFNKDVGTIIVTCNATDDENQVSEASFTVNIAEGKYESELLTWLRNESDLTEREEYDNLTGDVTKRLLNEPNLWLRLGANTFCMPWGCFNINEDMHNITTYFDNYANNLTVSEQLNIYGPDWVDYMNNEGYGDSDLEAYMVLFNITQI